MTEAPTGNRRGRRSREELLEGAARLFAERGYAGTSVAALSDATGLPKSAIYHHFHSKGGVLSAVMERGLNDFFEAMRAAHAEPPEDGTHRERMAWFLKRTSEVFMARQEFLRLHMILILSAEAADVEVADTIAKVRDDGRVHMHRMIEESFRDEGPEVAKAVADELDYFGIAGFDGAFIAMQADPARDIVKANEQLADAMVLLGEGIVARLRAAEPKARRRR
ncbi:MAG: TetR/AcrR family transcriptional regulator [Nocardioidaceae bacterium]|nr:TetR/AcrR family transcriptional regulator [Nocardioidaceae bacterium]MCL2612511.1 TetR/AcrR family transcriptional regulator [Nocardioidaceae bacterium]